MQKREQMNSYQGGSKKALNHFLKFRPISFFSVIVAIAVSSFFSTNKHYNSSDQPSFSEVITQSKLSPNSTTALNTIFDNDSGSGGGGGGCNITSGGTITGNQFVCGSYNPAFISNTRSASGCTSGGGGSGSGGGWGGSCGVIYQWQQKALNGNWANIGGATGVSYDPGIIYQTYWYRRAARSACGTIWRYSNSIDKHVIVNYTNGGLIAGNETNCGSYNPNTVTNVTLPSGGYDSGNQSTTQYIWQQRVNGGNWQTISGAIATSYNPGMISQTTEFRRGTRLSRCSNYIFSNAIIKTVDNSDGCVPPVIPCETISVRKVLNTAYECEGQGERGVFFRRGGNCTGIHEIWAAQDDLYFYEYSNGTAEMSGSIIRNGSVGQVQITFTGRINGYDNTAGPCSRPQLLNSWYSYDNFNGTIQVGGTNYSVDKKGADMVIGYGAPYREKGFGFSAWTEGSWGGCGELWGQLGPQVPNSITGIAFDDVNQDGILAKGAAINLALNKPASASSIYSVSPSLAVDGNTNGDFHNNFVFHTGSGDNNTWWQVDLEESQWIDYINFWNRTDCCKDRSANIVLVVSENPISNNFREAINTTGNFTHYFNNSSPNPSRTINVNCFGRYVKLFNNKSILNFSELEVFGKPFQEAGIADIEVKLYECSGGTNGANLTQTTTLVATTTTTTNGRYTFDNLCLDNAPNAYFIEFDRGQFDYSLAGQGNDPFCDSDANQTTGQTACFVLTNDGNGISNASSGKGWNVGLIPGEADLSLTKAVDKTEVAPGDDVSFMITVTNDGPGAATNVSVLDILPAGLQYLTHATEPGNFNPATGIWDIGTLASGSSSSLLLATLVTSDGGTITNFAQVQTSGTDDPDSTPGNDTDNTPNEDDEDDVTITVTPPCDLDLAITDLVCSDNNTPSDPSDDTYTFNLTVTGDNTGVAWQASFSNPFFGTAIIPPTVYGIPVQLGPFPAGTFTATNVAPPLTVTDGLDIDISVTDTQFGTCSNNTITVNSPGPCSDGPPPSLTITDITVNEEDGTATLQVCTSVPSTEVIMANFVTMNGTAIVNSDYGFSSGKISIPAGQLCTEITVLIINDDIGESTENLVVNLSNPMGATIADPQGMITILDGDGDPNPPTLTINDITVNEEDGTATLQICASETSTSPITVDFATADGSAITAVDYGTTTGTVTIPAGQSCVEITVPIIDDEAPEPTESLVVNLTNPNGATINDPQGMITILDIDTPVEPALMISDITVNEEDGTATLQICASFISSTPITVNFATADGSAIASSDYGTTSGVVTIPANQLCTNITIPIIDDEILEPTEGLVVNLTNPNGATIADPQGMITILDDDNPQNLPMLTINDITVMEEDGIASLQICISQISATPVTVNYTTANGSAVVNNDYSFTSATATIPAGQLCVNVTVPITDDETPEQTENLVVNLTNPTNATIADLQGTITILDGDVPPPSLAINDITVNEEDGIATLQICASSTSTSPITVNFATANGSAIVNSDFAFIAGTATIPAGQLCATVTVQIIDDNIEELTENLVVNLTNPNNATIADPQGTITILDGDTPPVVPTININDITVNEEDGTATLQICASETSSSPITVNFATANGSAVVNADYGFNSGTATIPAGQLCANVTVQIIDDENPENTENLIVNLSNPNGATIADPQGTITILDSDIPPTLPDITINDITVNEEDGTATLQVSLSSPSATSVTVNYISANGSALTGVDYTTVFGTITFPAGSTQQTISVPIIDDEDPEDTENFAVNLMNPNNANITDPQGIVTILDKDTPPARPAISINDITVNEEDGTATLQICASETSNSPITVNFATANGSAVVNTDYGFNSGTATIPAGQLCTNVTVQIIDDSIEEPTENLVVNLTNPNNATIADPQGTITILDIDTPPTVPTISINDITVNEEDGTASLLVSLSSPSSNSVTVNYISDNGSAIDGSDYSFVGGTITFPAGNTQQTVTIPIIDDETPEPTENFAINLSNANNATVADPQGIVTILDIDTPPARPAISISDITVYEEDGTATLQVSLSHPFNSPVTVNYITENGSAILGSDYSFLGGTLTFPAGSTQQSITIPILDDNIEEPTENFVINLGNANNAIIADPQGVVTILDRDVPTSTCDNITFGGKIGFRQACAGTVQFCSTNIAGPIIRDCNTPTGGSGTLEIIWLKNETSCDAPTGTVEQILANPAAYDWEIIEGATDLSLDPGKVSTTTCFLRCARRAGCTTYLGESNIVQIAINPNCGGNSGETTESCGNGTSITYGNGQITMNGQSGLEYYYQVFDVNWSSIYSCGWQCGSSKTVTDLAEGDYRVIIKNSNWEVICEKVVTLSGDNTGGGNNGDNTGGDNNGDNTGGDNNGDNTGGDNNGDNAGGDNNGGNTATACGEITITHGNGEIKMQGQTDTEYYFQVFNANWETIFNCGWQCGSMQTVSGLPDGLYRINIKDSNWGAACEQEITLTSNNGGNGGSNDCPNITHGGQIGGDETDCNTFDPGMITNGQLPSGGAGEIEYIWLASTIGCPNELQDIVDGATDATFNPGSVSQTTYFVRCARRKGCTVWVESNCVVKTVDNCNGNNDGGAVNVIEASCGELSLTYGNGTIEIEGQAGKDYYFKLNDLNNGWALIDGCSYECGATFTANNVPNTKILVTIFDNSWTKHCEIELEMTGSNNLTGATGRNANQLAFSAHKVSRAVGLEWITNSGYKNDYYVIERSLDGENFTTLQQLTNKEWSEDMTYHQTDDEQPQMGANFYRVKQVYVDGTFDYTAIQKVDFNIDLDGFSMYPNPARDELSLNLKPFAGKSVAINIINHFGQIVKTTEINKVESGIISLPLDRINSGFYQVMIQTEGQKTFTRKLIIERLY